MEKLLATYNIYIQGLEDNVHEFEFEGSDSFFEIFQSEDPTKGNFTAKVIFDKSATMIVANFEIDAEVTLECDRSLELYEESLSIDEKYIFKFGDRHEEVAEDMEVIPFGAIEINVAQHIFDFIALAIPVKKIHPSLRDDDDENDYVIFEGKEEENNLETPPSDPRWGALEGLKNKLKDKN